MKKSFEDYMDLHRFLSSELFPNLKDWCHSDVKFYSISEVISEARGYITYNEVYDLYDVLINYCIEYNSIDVFNYIKGYLVAYNYIFTNVGNEKDFIRDCIRRSFASNDIRFFKKVFPLGPSAVYMFQIESAVLYGYYSRESLVKDKFPKLRFMLHFDIGERERAMIEGILGI